MTWGVVLAAGSGRRFGEQKQFARLGDLRVVDHVVARAKAVCEGVCVVLPPGQVWDGEDVELVVGGGPTHAMSARLGIDALPAHVDIALIAAASHPLASLKLYRTVIAAVLAGADAAAPSLPLPDALKRVGPPLTTVDRTDLVTVQMPMAFRLQKLRSLLEQGMEVAEELELFEQTDGLITLVDGESSNLHIATAEDLQAAAALLCLTSLKDST